MSDFFELNECSICGLSVSKLLLIWLSTAKCELDDSRETPVWQFYQIPNNQLDFIEQVVLNMAQSFVGTILVEGENILVCN